RQREGARVGAVGQHDLVAGLRVRQRRRQLGRGRHVDRRRAQRDRRVRRRVRVDLLVDCHQLCCTTRSRRRQAAYPLEGLPPPSLLLFCWAYMPTLKYWPEPYPGFVVIFVDPLIAIFS